MVSVCMTTHNGEKFILKQINSILSQLSVDDELIISDDNSTDNTLKIIRDLNDKRIIIFNFKKNESRLHRLCINRQLTKRPSTDIITTSLRRPREIGKDNNVYGGFSPFICLAFPVRLLFLEDPRMRCFRQNRKAKEALKMPFIGDAFAASVRLATSSYALIPGFCMQTVLRRQPGFYLDRRN